MTTQFAFRNVETEEVRWATGASLNLAARSLGFEVPFGGPLPHPWVRWECWEGRKCAWHCTADGRMVAGLRP